MCSLGNATQAERLEISYSVYFLRAIRFINNCYSYCMNCARTHTVTQDLIDLQQAVRYLICHCRLLQFYKRTYSLRWNGSLYQHASEYSCLAEYLLNFAIIIVIFSELLACDKLKSIYLSSGFLSVRHSETCELPGSNHTLLDQWMYEMIWINWPDEIFKQAGCFELLITW